MKPKTLLVLTLLVAALAAFIWFVERDLPSSEERSELASRVLPVEPAEIAAVAIDWNGRKVRLERRAEEGDGDGAGDDEGGEDDGAPVAPAADWWLTEPYEARADAAAADTLLEALTGLRKARTLEDVERSAVGLDTPRGAVTLTTGDGDRRLLVGAPVPASEDVIVALEGSEEVWVTSASFLSQLEKEAGEWRSRDVVAVAREDVRRLRLRSAEREEPVVLVRREGRFHLESPVDDLADGDLADRLLADLATLRAARFLGGPGEAEEGAPPDGELGLDPPRATLEAELAGGDTLRVDLGAPAASAGSRPPGAAPGDPGAVYARVGDQRFETVTGLAEALGRPPAEWRSPSWSALSSFEVDRVEVEEAGTGETLVLSRAGVDWRRGDETIPYTAASDLLYALTEAKGEVSDGEEPADPPLLTVRLASDGGAEETLTLWGRIDPAPGEEARHPARSSSRSALLRVTGETAEEVFEAVRAARTAEPEPPEAPDGE